MILYQHPALLINLSALAVTGDVNFIVLLSQGECCLNQDLGECNFPVGVPLPGSIHVDNRQITLLFGEAQAGCPTSGPIDSNGHFSIDISSCFEESNNAMILHRNPTAAVPGHRMKQSLKAHLTAVI